MSVNLVEVRPSAGKGRGVFATQAIRKGQPIEVAPVLLVPVDDEPFILHTFLQHYTFSVPVGDDEQARTGIALGNASLYNHSRKSNADWRITSECIIVFATKNIRKGQEILVDYGWDSRHKKEVGIVEK